MSHSAPVRRIAAVGALMLTIAGCTSPSGPVPAETVTPTVVADKTAPPEPVVPATWPLTGVEADVVERPAVAVKIENTAAARPQTGLEDADVVWESIVEFGVSRFAAVYHSRLPEEVGPIRSTRPADASIASPLGGLVAFSGGSEGILALMARTPLQLLSNDAGDPGFYRVSTRPSPHNLYGSLETFLGQADASHRSPPPEQFAFAVGPGSATAAAQGTAATSLTMTLAPGVAPSWAWDGEAGGWLRSEGGLPAVSASGVRLSATNVVVIVVESFDSGFDAQLGEPVPDLRLVGSGEGTLASGGMAVPVTWSKASRDAPLVLTGPDGSAATLAPGNTWVELVPLGTGTYVVG